MPEARLAREAGLCYQTVAMATDYDCWNEEAGDVSLEVILRVLEANANTSRKLVAHLIENLYQCSSGCGTAMQNSVVTLRDLWPKSKALELETLLQ